MKSTKYSNVRTEESPTSVLDPRMVGLVAGRSSCQSPILPQAQLDVILVGDLYGHKVTPGNTAAFRVVEAPKAKKPEVKKPAVTEDVQFKYSPDGISVKRRNAFMLRDLIVPNGPQGIVRSQTSVNEKSAAVVLDPIRRSVSSLT